MKLIVGPVKTTLLIFLVLSVAACQSGKYDKTIKLAGGSTGVIVKSGVWAFSSSGDLIILHDFDTVFKFNSSNNFPEAVEAA